MKREKVEQLINLWEEQSYMTNDKKSYDWLIQVAKVRNENQEVYINLHKELDRNIDFLVVEEDWGENITQVALNVIKRQREYIEKLRGNDNDE